MWLIVELAGSVHFGSGHCWRVDGVEEDNEGWEVAAEASVDLGPAVVNDIRTRDEMHLVQVAEAGADQAVISWAACARGTVTHSCRGERMISW